MVSAIDVGQYIYDKLGWVDAWRLEKLAYYSQAWALGWYGRPIMDDEFQAWPDGPVEPSLFRHNKHFRSTPYSTELPAANRGVLTPLEMAIIDAVLEFYGEMSKEELIVRTHSESPWLKARGDLAEREFSSNPISQAEMTRCYALQEIERKDVPQRPVISLPRNDGISADARLAASASRWKKALDILATR